MEFMTREVFDTLIIGVIIIGVILSSIRLYRDLTRPLPNRARSQDDTQPIQTQNDR